MLADREKRKVIRIEGNPDDPISKGHICSKATALKGVFEDPDRIKRPIRKTASGEWEEISWDEAYNYAAERIGAIQAEHGNDALGVYIGNPSGFDLRSVAAAAHGREGQGDPEEKRNQSKDGSDLLLGAFQAQL